MLIACWSAKGGSGTTVTATALALLLASRSREPVTLVDLAGDVPSALGLAPPDLGVAAWLADEASPPEALDRIAVRTGRGLAVLPAGEGAVEGDDLAGERLAAVLAERAGATVVDCGQLGLRPSPGRGVAAHATLSLLVTRPCYLAMRRAATVPLRPSAVVLVDEPARVLSARDVEAVLDAPVRAVIPADDRIARAVDAGLMGAALPRVLERALQRAVR